MPSRLPRRNMETLDTADGMGNYPIYGPERGSVYHRARTAPRRSALGYQLAEYQYDNDLCFPLWNSYGSPRNENDFGDT